MLKWASSVIRPTIGDYCRPPRAVRYAHGSLVLSYDPLEPHWRRLAQLKQLDAFFRGESGEHALHFLSGLSTGSEVPDPLQGDPRTSSGADHSFLNSSTKLDGLPAEVASSRCPLGQEGRSGGNLCAQAKRIRRTRSGYLYLYSLASGQGVGDRLDGRRQRPEMFAGLRVVVHASTESPNYPLTCEPAQGLGNCPLSTGRSEVSRGEDIPSPSSTEYGNDITLCSRMIYSAFHVRKYVIIHDRMPVRDLLRMIRSVHRPPPAAHSGSLPRRSPPGSAPPPSAE